MHILLRVGETSNGSPSFEMVHAVWMEGRRYKIEFTPGLAYGIAAGDEIEVDDGGDYAVLARAGNVAIRVFSETPFDGFQNALSAAVEGLSGRLDGSRDCGLAYTIPVRAGFVAIERIFNEFVTAYPACVWEFGNVYAEDGSPLGWWADAA